MWKTGFKPVFLAIQLGVFFLITNCDSKVSISAEIKQLTDIDTTQVISPDAPTNLTATETGVGQVTLTWDAIPGVTEYYIYFGNTSVVTAVSGNRLPPVTTNSFVHNVPNYPADYYYRVSAAGTTGESGLSATAYVFVRQTPACGNTTLEFGEQCDDGNIANGDRCSSTCQDQYVISGVVNNASASATLGTVTFGSDAAGNNPITMTAPGTFQFPSLDVGTVYDVTVLSDPVAKRCIVSSGAGTLAAADVTGVVIDCYDAIILSINVTGVLGGGLVFQNNGGDDLAVSVDGAYDFATALITNEAYNVTVLTQPSAPIQTCTVNAPSGNIVTNTTLNVNCVTNDISFTAGSAITVAENAGTVAVPLALTNPSWKNVIVNYTVTGQVSGADYSAPGSFTIPAGTLPGDAIITIVDDNTHELSENLILTFSTPDANLVGGNVYTITITDNDAAPLVSIGTGGAVNENAGTYSIPVTLDRPSYEPITVTFAANIGSTALAGVTEDYTFVQAPQEVSFAAGATSASVDITLNDDGFYEPAESLLVDLSAVTVGVASINAGAASSTVTLNDNEATPVVSIAGGATIAESAGAHQLTVQITPPTFEPVTVTFAIDPATTATAVTDYTVTTPGSTVTIPARTSTAPIDFSIVDGANDYELSETIVTSITTLAPAAPYTIDGVNNIQTITITDNEAPPTISIAPSVAGPYTELGGTVITLNVTTDNTSYEPIVVNYAAGVASTATVTEDYTMPAGPATIAAGATLTSFNVTLVDDAHFDGIANETIEVNLGTITGTASLAAAPNNSAILSIIDNETAPQVTLATTNLSPVSIAEVSGSEVMVLSLDTQSDSPVDVNLALNGTSTATSGSDFSALPATVTIPAFTSTANFTLTALDDATEELDETVVMDIASVTGGAAIAGGAQQQTVTIAGNDFKGPVITSVGYYDTDGNGKIDHVRVDFDEAVSDASIVNAQWSIYGYSAPVKTLTPPGQPADVIDNAVVWFSFAEGAGSDTGAKPDLTAAAATVVDVLPGNCMINDTQATCGVTASVALGTLDIIESDQAAPKLISVTPWANPGANDSVLIVFSEAITDNSAGGACPASIANTLFTYNENVAGTVNSLTGGASFYGIYCDRPVFATFDGIAPAALTIGTDTGVGADTIAANAASIYDANANVLTDVTPVEIIALPRAVWVTASGLNTGNSVNVSLGAETLTLSDVSPMQSFTATVNDASAYSIVIASQPAGQICSMEEAQYGLAAGADISLHVNCVNGYGSGSSVLEMAAAKLSYHLYQGKVSTLISSATTIAGTALNNATGLGYYNGDLYIGDASTSRIIKYRLSDGATTVLATGLGGNPRHLVIDGTNLYYSNETTKYVVQMDVNTGAIIDSFYMGVTGFPSGLALDRTNKVLYVAMRNMAAIQQVDLTTGLISTLTTDPLINGSEDLEILNGKLYVATFANKTVVEINPVGPTVAVIAGTGTAGFVDGPLLSSAFNNTEAITTDGSDLYVGEGGRLRKIDMTSGIVSTIAGGPANMNDGIGIGGGLKNLLALASDGRSLYALTDLGPGNGALRKIVNNGLVGYWPLAGNGNDYGSDGANGPQTSTVTGAPVVTATDRYGIANRYYTFDGVDDVIKVSAANLPTGNASRSLCVWMKPSSLANQQDGIATYGDGGAGTNFGIKLGANNYKLQSWDGASQWEFGLYSIPSSWIHLCTVHDSSASTTKMYYNGHLVNSVSAYTYATAAAAELWIGQKINSTVDYYNGAIADLRIYNRTLNEGEINELSQDALSGNVGISYNSGPTGLLNHFTFNGGALTDSGPLAYDVTNNGAAVVATGKDGDASGAMSFDKTVPQFLEKTGVTTDGMGTGNDVTISAWVAPKSLPTTGADSIHTIISRLEKVVTSGPDGYYLELYQNAGTQFIAWSSAGGSGNSWVYPVTLPLNSWTNVTIVQSGSTATLYINGAIVAPSTSNPSVYVPDPNVGSLLIGKRTDGFPFDGNIDDVRIYNNALTAAQVRQLSTQVPSGLVAHYDFNGDATDTSGWGNDATVNAASTGGANAGGAALTPDSNGLVSAYNFDGTDDNILTPVDIDGDVMPSVTLVGRVRPTLIPDNTDVQAFFSNEDANWDRVFGLEIGGAGLVVGDAANANPSWAATTDPLVATNTWQHVAVTFNRAGNTLVYYNGGLIGTTLNTDTAGLGTTTQLLALGANPATPSLASFAGDLDNVQIYNRQLTPAEIHALMGKTGPATVSVAVDNATIPENVAGSTATFTISLDHAVDTDVVLNVSLGATNAEASDYSMTPALGATVTIPAYTLHQTFAVQSIDDGIYDDPGDETVQIVINSIASGPATLGTATASTLIIENETVPVVTFAGNTTSSVAENVGTTVITATMSPASEVAVQVQQSRSGTATSGVDHDFTAGWFNFTAGATSANTATITIVDDTTEEFAETIVVNLFSVTAGTATIDTIPGNATHTLTIAGPNDVVAPTVTDVSYYDINQNGFIERAKVTFSEPMNDSTLDLAKWSVFGYTGLTHDTTQGDAANDNIIWIAFNESARFDTGAKPDFTAANSTLVDMIPGYCNLYDTAPNCAAASGSIGTVDVVEVDAAPPILIGAYAHSKTVIHDSVVATFTEGITGAASTAICGSPVSTAQLVYADINGAGATGINPPIYRDAGMCDSLEAVTTPMVLQAGDIGLDKIATSNTSFLYDAANNTGVLVSLSIAGAPTWNVNITVNGLGAGESLLLQNNGGDDLTVTNTDPNGTFLTPLANAAAYRVSIKTQNTTGKICAVRGALTKYVASAHANEIIDCVPGYAFGGDYSDVDMTLIPPTPTDVVRIDTLAGNGTNGSINGVGTTTASFSAPIGITKVGNMLYVADFSGNAIRKVDMSVNPPTVTTIATVTTPWGVVTDGSNLYVSGHSQNCVYKVNLTTNAVSTFAGTCGGAAGSVDHPSDPTLATFNFPLFLAFDANKLYVASNSSGNIRMIDLQTGAVTTPLTGQGGNIRGIAFMNGKLFVNNFTSYAIRVYDATTYSLITTIGSGVAGYRDAVGANALFNSMYDMKTDGHYIYVADTGNAAIRKVDPVTYEVTTVHQGLAGFADGDYRTAKISTPNASLYADGKDIYYADYSNNRIRKVSSGLMGHYTLDDAGAGTVTDTSGYGNNGANVAYVADIDENATAAGAYHLNWGATNYVEKITATIPNSPAETLSAWIYIDSYPGGYDVIRHGVPGTNTAYALYFYQAPPGTNIAIGCGSGGVSPGVPVPVGEWVHLAGTWTGATRQIYMNGKLIYNGTSGCPPPTNTSFTVQNEGMVSDLRVYNRVLSAGEIQRLATKVPNGLVTYYPFHNGAISDATIYKNDFTTIGGAPATATDKFGRLNEAYSIPVGSYFMASDLVLPVGSAPRTICTNVMIATGSQNGAVLGWGTLADNAYTSLYSNSSNVGHVGYISNNYYPGAFGLDTWGHLCVVADGLAWRFYMNGALALSTTSSKLLATASYLNRFVIGMGTDLTTYKSDSVVDEVRIYNRALTLAEVQAIMTQK